MGYAETVPANQFRSPALATCTPQMGLHRPCPSGRVDDQPPNSLWPEITIVSSDDGSHACHLGRRCTRRPRQHERSPVGPVIGRQQAEIRDTLIKAPTSDCHIAALEYDLGL